MTEIKMPRIGQTVDELTIVEWKKKAGDEVKLGDVLFEVETDKALLPVESYAAGILLELLHDEGDIVKVGDVCAIIGKPGEKAAENQASIKSPVEIQSSEIKTADQSQIESKPVSNIIKSNSGQFLASPAARQLIRESNINIQEIQKRFADKIIKRADVIVFLDEKAKAASIAPVKNYIVMQTEVELSAVNVYMQRLKAYVEKDVETGDFIVYALCKAAKMRPQLFSQNFDLRYGEFIVEGNKCNSLLGLIDAKKISSDKTEICFDDFSCSAVTSYVKYPEQGESVSVTCGAAKKDGTNTISLTFAQETGTIDINEVIQFISSIKNLIENPEFTMAM